MSNNSADPGRQQRRGRVHGIHVAIGVVIVMIGIIAVGAFSSTDTSRTRNAASGQSGISNYTPPDMCIPGEEEGITCVPLVLPPSTALAGLKVILHAMQSVDPSATCRLIEPNRTMAACAVKGGTENVPVPGSGSSPPSDPAHALAATVTAVNMMPGTSVQTTATLTNLGTSLMDVMAEVTIGPSTCSYTSPILMAPLQMPGLEVTPERTGQFPLPAGATMTIPLSVTADATTPVGPYQLCLSADAYEIGSSSFAAAGAEASASATLMNPPIDIDQSGLTNGYQYLYPGQSYAGTIEFSNTSPADGVCCTDR